MSERPQEDEMEFTPVRDRPRPPRSSSPREDWYINKAKRLIADNYNEHHDPAEDPVIRPEELYVLWFAKVLSNWKAIIGYRLVKGQMWMITFDSDEQIYYLEYYKRIANVPISSKPGKRRVQ